MTHSHLPIHHLLDHIENRSCRQPRRPDWIESFINAVATLFEPLQGVARVGFESRIDERGWEVSLYLGRTEMIGGQFDGDSRHPDFRFDVQGLIDQFSRVDAFEWEARPETQSSEPSHLRLQGEYSGQPLRVRVFDVAPTHIGPGLRCFPNGTCETV